MMKLVQSRWYANLITISDYILLGILWVLCSLPLVTVVASSKAAYYTINEWRITGTGSVLKTFWVGFKHRLLITLPISLTFIAIFAALESAMQQMELLPLPLLVAFIVSGVIVAMFFLCLIPELVHISQQSIIESLQNTAILVIGFLPQNLLKVFLTYVFFCSVTIFPPFIFLFAGGFWKLISLLTRQK